MFTGIIETIGRIGAVNSADLSARLSISVKLPDNDLKVGDSVAVNGVCLTVTSIKEDSFSADVGKETLKVTTLGQLKKNDFVNIERPLKMGGRLGGHLVLGHIDGVGKILKINKLQGGVEAEFEVNKDLAKYIITRGSITIDGTSLTVSRKDKDVFAVFLVPHTIEATILKFAKEGDPVNLEVDIIGKYVEKLARIVPEEADKESKITEEFLRLNGY